MKVEDKFSALFGVFPFGVFLVNTDMVNVDDLLAYAGPGQLIRVSDTSAVKFIPADDAPQLGCIAGWVSEDDA